MKTIVASLLCAVMIADGGATGVQAVIMPKEVEAVEVVEEAPEEPAKHLYGVCTITHYDNGPCCCGQYAYGATASGVMPTVNRTVASNCLPFGTRLLINGQEYTVEDRGDSNMNDFWIDIYVSSHEEALQRGMISAEVYIIDG